MAAAVKLISPEVLNVLARAQCEGQSLRLVGQLDRKLYVQTNDVLEAAGGKWNKKSKVHLFDSDAADAVEGLVLTGQYTRAKDVQAAFGYFETPEPVVKRMFAAVAVLPGAKFLEPSAGRGAIALHIIEQFRPPRSPATRYRNPTSTSWTSGFATGRRISAIARTSRYSTRISWRPSRRRTSTTCL